MGSPPRLFCVGQTKCVAESDNMGVFCFGVVTLVRGFKGKPAGKPTVKQDTAMMEFLCRCGQ